MAYKLIENIKTEPQEKKPPFDADNGDGWHALSI